MLVVVNRTECLHRITASGVPSLLTIPNYPGKLLRHEIVGVASTATMWVQRLVVVNEEETQVGTCGCQSKKAAVLPIRAALACLACISMYDLSARLHFSIQVTARDLSLIEADSG
jgi:hypothetical protein